MESFALKQLTQMVYEYCGLNYQTNSASLETKIAGRLQQLHVSVWEYIRLLEQSTAEWDVLVELLTINETYFYREDKQLAVYQNEVLPELIAQNPDRTLQVWSAACSSGEEPYSLAITTIDSGLCPPQKVAIKGTDINKKVLQAAASGIYNKQSLSFRRIPDRWLKHYFIEQPDAFRVIEPVKSMVAFEQLNLLDSFKMGNLRQQYDVIFCRNVLIYFDSETIKKVASYFYQALKGGGYLFLGHAENISTMGIGFQTMSKNGTFYYRKESADGQANWCNDR
ncbi:CheR family methyltransferase [Pseudobacillus wudalianchiensis]|uniref:protein-glutamate O-methyltransferase n=1 Tax=Pseudobacillus wudalianchiensis TaxID=1743143 RepID=A0A1B9ADM3_9BACI|nr:protein-glutamate O-methyltransferase CheR [Bacillus wudalianchiensis]OCA81953.1 hypothetical protein A8F95_14655 [Bacillus wudalianchiensis]